MPILPNYIKAQFKFWHEIFTSQHHRYNFMASSKCISRKNWLIQDHWTRARSRWHPRQCPLHWVEKLEVLVPASSPGEKSEKKLSETFENWIFGSDKKLPSDWSGTWLTSKSFGPQDLLCQHLLATITLASVQNAPLVILAPSDRSRGFSNSVSGAVRVNVKVLKQGATIWREFDSGSRPVVVGKSKRLCKLLK